MAEQRFRHLRNVWRFQRPVLKTIPVKHLVPSVLLNIITVVIAQTLGGGLLAEHLHHVDGGLCDVTREVDLINASKDYVVDLHGVAGSERRAGRKRCQSEENT